jgi:hypothetical protein
MTKRSWEGHEESHFQAVNVFEKLRAIWQSFEFPRIRDAGGEQKDSAVDLGMGTREEADPRFVLYHQVSLAQIYPVSLYHTPTFFPFSSGFFFGSSPVHR